MSGFEIQHNRFRKISGVTETHIDKPEHNRLRAIVKVNVDGYVPEHVELRQRIDGEMFTAEFDSDLLDELEEDEGVASVAVSEKLDIIE
jgi:hypothetical protein